MPFFINLKQSIDIIYLNLKQSMPHLHRRKPGAEFGGTEKISQTKISELRFFLKKSIFTPKISDDFF